MERERSAYDEELAGLHDKLAATAIGYGRAAPAVAMASAVAEKAPIEEKAARAGFLAKNKKAVGGEGDLVEGITTGAVKLDDVQADLPADMKAMSKDKQAALIAAKQKERNEITERIDQLTKLRRKELDAHEAAAAKAGKADSFDVAAKKALKKSVRENALDGLTLD